MRTSICHSLQLSLLATSLLVCSPQLFAGDVLTAEFPQDLSSVQVSLCFDGDAPDRLYRNSQTRRWSDGIYLEQQRLQTRDYDGTVRLPALAKDSCIQWQANLDSALKNNNRRAMTKVAGDLIMNADVWFWQGPRGRDLTVRVKMPNGFSFSTPWKPIGEENGFSVYRPDDTPPEWETKLAIGEFKIQIIDIPGAQLRLATPGKVSPSQQQKFVTWIEESASSVSTVSDQFPQPQPQVLVIPSGNGQRATQFGQVIRGGGMTVAFWVNENRPLQEFRDDWTATHEFSHLLLPYIRSRDRWLSEGLASYYQNVLRARNGRLTETQAWQDLFDGFERGRQGTGTGSLVQASRRGRASTMQVYWSGAALMLMADIQLRANSNGQQSLDTALNSLSACCLENGKTWRARDMFKQLDSLTGTQIFSDIYQNHANAEGFPDMQKTWGELGIINNDNQVSLESDAPMADIREAIMKG